MASRNTAVSPRLRVCALTNGAWTFPLLFAALFLTALLWSHARDPFRRNHFPIRTQSGKAEAVAVLPHCNESFPVAIFAHGSGGDIMRDGTALRLFAEQGLAAISFEYDQTNQAAFDEQFIALHKYLGKQKWAGPNNRSVAWIGCRLGAQRMLSFFIRHRELQPRVLVRISGGWVDDLKPEDKRRKAEREQPANSRSRIRETETNSSTLSSQLSTKVLLLHGEQDEVFPVGDCWGVATWFETNGIPVTLKIIPNHGHDFGEDQPLLFRTAAEFCASQFSGSDASGQTTGWHPVQVNLRPTLWWYWIPAGLLCLIVFAARLWPHLMRSLRYGNRVLWIVAAVLGLLAFGDCAIHFGLPYLRASPRTLNWTRSWLVRPEMRADFDWLVRQPIERNQRIGTLLQHLELADYNRQLVNWKNDDSVYREFVLSPQLGTNESEIRWRRMLWESFYPRIRHESSPEAAAEIVVRFLRERVTVLGEPPKHQAIPEIWQSGIADPTGFEQIYVAALRSVGVPARLGADAQAEIFTAEKWQPAPRPMVLEVVGSPKRSE